MFEHCNQSLKKKGEKNNLFGVMHQLEQNDEKITLS